MGKWKVTSSLKNLVAGLFALFCSKSICHEAIASFKNMNVEEFLRSTYYKFPVDVRWLQDNEVQISGFQRDVERVLEAFHRKIEQYQSEIIEVKAQYESVPYAAIKESLFQERFPTSPFVSTEVLANDPATLVFRGPRQKLLELGRRFEELLSDFYFLPVFLSEPHLQFVKAQWGKIFHDGFFFERNILAVLEISEIVEVGGLSLGEIKEAEKILTEQVCEEYQSEIIEVEARYETVPYAAIKESLFQRRLPVSPFVTTEVLANDPTTIVFRGPRQKLIELGGHFEELLTNFKFLPVSLSELQLQFVKAQWGKLFHGGFFFIKNTLAVLEVSEMVQVGGLSLGEIKEAEKVLREQVCEKTVGISDQLQWVTEESEWEDFLNRLKSRKSVAIHFIPSNQVTLVGPSSQIAMVEEYIKEYLRDNSTLKESMKFTKPELVLAGGQVLHIMKWEHLKVNIKHRPSNYRLLLQVKGLRKFVKQAIPVITMDLDSLVHGMIPLERKTLCTYFSEEGADVLKNMGETLKCVVIMQTQESHRYRNGGILEGLAEDYRAVIHLVGVQSKVIYLKQRLLDFISKFYKETICSAEISAFSDDDLKALCETISIQYPVGFHRLRAKMVCVCGSQEDVEKVSRKIYAKLEEVLIAKVQKAEAEQTVSKLLFETVRWYHKTDAGWSTFDVLTNRYLEEEYGGKKTETMVPWNREKLLVNFLKYEAFVPGKRKFRIKREICLWDKNIAPFWEGMDGCLIKKVELKAYSKEYQDVLKNFNKTAGHYKVVKIERIQNQYLWISYCWKKSWMEKRNPEGTQNERILFHGTLPSNCSSVCDIGFKNAFRKQCIYGKGIYFSVAAGHSVFYAKPDHRGLRYVFQVRVLTGEYESGKENMALPPMKPEGNGRYDSLVDVRWKPNIFVVFFDDHAYPEYLITFRS